MPEAASILHGWDSFYVIVGSSSAALTGLMFVVVSLLPESRRRSATTPATFDAYATPTVVHFCAALLISALLTTPWGRLWEPGVAIGVTGIAGLIYSLIVTRRVQRAPEYRPAFEDWLWHVTLPIASYFTLILSGLLLKQDTTGALFGAAAATLLLLFIGIHNAWDTVTYITLEIEPDPPKDKANK